jgi:hypothetical protein
MTRAGISSKSWLKSRSMSETGHGERSKTVNIRQVAPWANWPSGDSKPIAVLALEPKELAARYGLTFRKGLDDLGAYRLVAVELSNGVQAWISNHDGDPNPGSVVYVDAGLDIAKAQTQLVNLLGISRDDLLWAAPRESQARVPA